MAARVSIGMPVFNGERFLEQAIASIMTQEFSDFELIISDNASTDRTEEICRGVAAADQRIVYQRNETNLGAAANYNRVFYLASGKYFRWAAHDDVCAPALLRRCVEVLDNSPPWVVLCYPKTLLIDEQGRELGGYEDRMNIRFPRPHQRLFSVLKHLEMCNAVFGLIRTDALRATHLIGHYVASDMVLLAELSLLGEFREIPEALFLRRRHAAASCFANPEPEQRAVWFDPANTGRRVLPVFGMFVKHLKMITGAPISQCEKLRCYEVAMAHWLPKWRVMGSEFTRVLKHRWMNVGASR